MFVRSYLKQIPGVQSVVRRARDLVHQAVGYREPTTADYIREAFHSDDVFSVQVGSNDGKQGDPIFDSAVGDPRWSGILIEPVPYAFDRLRENYGQQERFIFENVAISDASGIAPFYFVSEDAKRHIEELPEWFDQLGSFDRAHISKHLDGQLTPFIEEKRIERLPLTAVLEKHRVNRVDLLHIDTEGHDWKVLSQLDLRKYRPRMIIFEYVHLAEAELEQAERRLSNAGYDLRKAGIDVIATRNGLAS